MSMITAQWAEKVTERAKEAAQACDNMVGGLEAWGRIGIDTDMLDTALGDIHKKYLMLEHTVKLAKSKCPNTTT